MRSAFAVSLIQAAVDPADTAGAVFADPVFYGVSEETVKNATDMLFVLPFGDSFVFGVPESFTFPAVHLFRRPMKKKPVRELQNSV